MKKYDILPFCRAGRTQISCLSIGLKVRTASLHQEAETLLGLPQSIVGRDDYANWLERFLGYYAPLERAFDTFRDWKTLEPFPARSVQSQRLARDLDELGFDRSTLAGIPTAPCPSLPTFAHALGARYVLEGSTLGGKVILRVLLARIGPQIAGATEFLGGGQIAPESSWRVFKMAVDRFGDQRPACREDVLKGAERTFRGLLDWFEPFVAGTRNHSSPACPTTNPSRSR